MKRVAGLLVALAVAACGSVAPTGSPMASPTSLATSAATASAAPAPSSAAPPSASPTAAPIATLSPAPQGPFAVSSTAFTNGGEIPAAYTCHGSDVSPDISWTGVPAGVKALVLLVTDQDAASFAHWIALDIPTSVSGLGRGAGAPDAQLQQGMNDFGRVGWGGPCPPSGTHHYRFTLYALAAPLGLAGHPSLARVRSALAAAGALGSTRFEGWYKRP